MGWSGEASCQIAEKGKQLLGGEPYLEVDRKGEEDVAGIHAQIYFALL